MKSSKAKKPSKPANKPASKKVVGKKAVSKKAPARKPLVSKRPASKKTISKVVAKPAKRAVAAPAAAKKKPAAKPASRSPIVDIVLRAMEDMKAVNVVTLDVRGVTDIADAMVIASGNSDRHVRSIAERVREFAKQAGYRPLGVEGDRDGEWVLVDLNDVIVHVMLPRVREFYRLESLWDVTAARREAAE
jgi:ribosome-associated protein